MAQAILPILPAGSTLITDTLSGRQSRDRRGPAACPAYLTLVLEKRSYACTTSRSFHRFNTNSVFINNVMYRNDLPHFPIVRKTGHSHGWLRRGWAVPPRADAIALPADARTRTWLWSALALCDITLVLSRMRPYTHERSLASQPQSSAETGGDL